MKIPRNWGKLGVGNIKHFTCYNPFYRKHLYFW